MRMVEFQNIEARKGQRVKKQKSQEWLLSVNETKEESTPKERNAF